MRQFYHRASQKLGMSIRQFLASHSSSDITELLVMENLPYWGKRFAEPTIADVKSEESRKMITAIFGDKIRKGEVKWRKAEVSE